MIISDEALQGNNNLELSQVKHRTPENALSNGQTLPGVECIFHLAALREREADTPETIEYWSAIAALYGRIPGVMDYLQGVQSREGEAVAIAVFEELENKQVAIADSGEEDSQLSGRPLTGKEVKLPSCTCDQARFDGTSWHVRKTKLTVSSRMAYKSKKEMSKGGDRCEFHYGLLVNRHVKQVGSELREYEYLFYNIVTPAEKKRLKTKWQNAKAQKGIVVSWLYLPSLGDEGLLIHSSSEDASHEIPYQKDKLFELLHKYVDTAKGRRRAASQGWGRNYKGVRGDGRLSAKEKANEPAITAFAPKVNIDRAAQIMDHKIKEGQTGFSLQKTNYQVGQAMADSGEEFFSKRGERILAADVYLMRGEVTPQTSEVQNETTTPEEQANMGILEIRTDKRGGKASQDTKKPTHRTKRHAQQSDNMGQLRTGYESEYALLRQWGGAGVYEGAKDKWC